jgi:hypothetical protein
VHFGQGLRILLLLDQRDGILDVRAPILVADGVVSEGRIA